MKATTLQAIVQARRQEQAVALVTRLEDHHQQIYFADNLQGSHKLEQAIDEALRSDRSKVVEIEGQKQFIQVFNQPLRLLIVGAVHIAQALIPIAQNCAYEVILIDPRRAFATEERFPNVELKNEWPDKALKSLGINSRTAVVTLTHDPKLDEPALIEALNSKAFYVGALGSRRTHQARCQRLLEADISTEILQRIHAPIGLDIGAVSPDEIAVSIVAQMTAVLRNKVVS